jgi:hypothetical protein
MATTASHRSSVTSRSVTWGELWPISTNHASLPWPPRRPQSNAARSRGRRLRAYSGEDDRLFRRNVTGDSGCGQNSVSFDQNRRSRSVGTTRHVQTESAVNMVRNTHMYLDLDYREELGRHFKIMTGQDLPAPKIEDHPVSSRPWRAWVTSEKSSDGCPN